MPLPSTLLIVGVLAGLLVGLLMRIPLGVGASRRGRKARKAIEQQVEQHARTRVIAQVQAVADDRTRIGEMITTAPEA